MIVPIVLAGGEGRRYVGQTHKLLAPIGRKKIIDYPLLLANKINNNLNFCITSVHVDEYIKGKFPNTIRIYQKKPLGTAHALSLIKNKINNNANIIVLYGDMPLIRYSSLKPMINYYKTDEKPLLMIFKSKKNLDFGRVSLENNYIKGIKEFNNIKKKTFENSFYKYKIYNGGVIISKLATLKHLLDKIGFDINYKQKLLTDIFKIGFVDGFRFKGYYLKNNLEMIGLNNNKDYKNILKYK